MSNNKCPDCSKPMKMYFVPRCFHCKKPQPKKVEVYELFPVMYYLQNNYSEFNKDKFWHWLCSEVDFHNGDIVYVTIPEQDQYYHYDKDLWPMFDLFWKEFPDHDNTRFEISW